jgi:hypothetical protein
MATKSFSSMSDASLNANNIRLLFHLISETGSAANNKTPVTLDSVVELAKRAFALGKTEEAVEFYATALELMYASFACSIEL